jgi:hypothetical protein
MNPYILMPQPMQDVSGLQPVFQNFGQQQANQQAALAQQGQLAQQAGQTQGGGMNPLAMAALLRSKDLTKKDPTKPETMGGRETPNWSNPYANYDNGATSGSSGIE